MAQRLFPRTGWDILEIETDGKRLLLRLTPPYDRKRADTATDTYRWAGDALGHGRFVPEGKGEAAQHLLLPPNPFQQHRDEGYYRLSRAEWKLADTAFGKALALRPQDAACWFARGLAYEGNEQGNSSAGVMHAIAAYGKAIALEPARIPAYRNRARLFAVAKQTARVLADLTQVMRLEPRVYTNYILRAQAYADKGDFVKAAADTRKATQVNPEESAPFTLLAQYLYRSGSYPQAIASAQKAIAQSDSENEARLILVYIYARQNQVEKAKKQLRDAHDNGITYTERSDGITEVRRLLKTQPQSAALKTVYTILRGPDNLEPA